MSNSIINAVLYSDQIIPANRNVDRHLLDMLGEPRARIGYIPSGPDPDRRFYHDRKSYYAYHGLELGPFFDLDENDGGGKLSSLLNCDAIHLSGGNTAAFLARLRRHEMLAPLRAWAQRGGVLIGTSAGAILMTPTINVDALFSGRRPEDLEDGDALALLPFEFFPHLNDEYLGHLVSYSRRIARPIVGCPDGDGVVVTQGKVLCVGNPVWISNGAVDRIPERALGDL